MKKIIIIHNPADDPCKDRLAAQLRVMPDLTPWSMNDIDAGLDRPQAIAEAIEDADATVLLISADFLNDTEIKKTVLPILQKRQKAGLKLIPLIARPCTWESVEWLQGLDALPADGAALSAGNDHEREDRLAAVCRAVHGLLFPEAHASPIQTVTDGPVRVFAAFQTGDDACTGALCQGTPNDGRALKNIRLDLDDPVAFDGGECRLIDFSAAADTGAAPADLQKEEAQLAAGAHLYDAVAGGVLDALPDTDEADIRILCPDDRIAELPWQMLNRNGAFCTALGWSVSLACDRRLENVDVTETPKILIVAPQPKNMAKTGAESHLEALEDSLSARNHAFRFGKNMETADTWSEFIRRIKTFAPDILYFYGRAALSQGQIALCFADGRACHKKDVTLKDLAAALDASPARPKLICLNCPDLGAGILDAGRTLGAMAPAVIISRNVNDFNAAADQGLKLLESVAADGVPPHRAASALCYNMDEPPDLTTAKARRMAPVLFCHYDAWNLKAAAPPSREIHDPYWHLKIDRVAQFSIVAQQTQEMIGERKPKSLAFVWYGTEGQGLDRFHHRLTVQLRESLEKYDTFLFEIKPDWPIETERPEIAFRDCLLDAFDVNALEDVPAAVRHMSQGVFGKQALIYVRHRPVTSPKIINPKSLKAYLNWWDARFVRILEPNQFALLGVSFIVSNPPKFLKQFENQRIEDVYHQRTLFKLLNEMESLAKKDLLDFLKTHSIHLPLKHRDRMIDRILEKTGGHYEKTVQELRLLVDREWDAAEAELEEEAEPQEDFDY